MDLDAELHQDNEAKALLKLVHSNVSPQKKLLSAMSVSFCLHVAVGLQSRPFSDQ